jgi:AraC-like DNA-binding protein
LESEEIGRHYHANPYATLVIEGSYEEAGDQGRYQVEAGDVLLHPAFSAHRDRVAAARTVVLDVPLPVDGRRWPGLGQLADTDLLIRLAERDVREAQQLLVEQLSAVSGPAEDPADRLADALSEDPSIAIGAWAEANDYSREWLSRRFRRVYGIDAAVFRLEARARTAWRIIVGTNEPLAEVAASAGFADQAHMSRAVGRLTGRSPGSWRRECAVTSVQE